MKSCHSPSSRPRLSSQTHPLISLSSKGNPVPVGERPPSTYSRRHRPVPLQRRGPQQDRYRRLLGRAVSQSVYQAMGLSPPYMRFTSPLWLEEEIMSWIYWLKKANMIDPADMNLPRQRGRLVAVQSFGLITGNKKTIQLLTSQARLMDNRGGGESCSCDAGTVLDRRRTSEMDGVIWRWNYLNMFEEAEANRDKTHWIRYQEKV